METVTFDTTETVLDPVGSLQTYLLTLAMMQNDHCGQPVSIEGLALRTGRWFDKPAVARPPDIRKGPNKYCFHNARALAMRWKKRFRYVEGYALSDIGFPCHHAWLIETATGAVVETTWAKAGHCYLGTVVEPSELRDCPTGSSVLERRAHSLHDGVWNRTHVWG